MSSFEGEEEEEGSKGEAEFGEEVPCGGVE